MSDQAAEKKDHATVINPSFITMVILGVAGLGIFLIMPMAAAALVTQKGFTEAHAGFFSTVQLICFAGGVMGSVLFIRRANPIYMALAAVAVLLIMDILAPFLAGQALFMPSRAIAGVCGGIMVSITTGYLAATRNTNLSFGLFLAAQLIFGMAGAVAIPTLTSAFGLAGIFWMLASMHVLVIVLLLKYAPPKGAIAAAEFNDSRRNTAREWLQSTLTLLAVLLFFTAVGAFWTFVGMLGLNAGLGEQEVATALSLAAFGGLVGAIMPTIVGLRFGRVVPIFGVFVVQLLALYLLFSIDTFMIFAVSVGLFSIGWYATYPYQVGVLTVVDKEGRATILSAACAGMGLGIGPQVVNSFPALGLAAVIPVALVFLVLSLAVILIVIYSSRQSLSDIVSTPSV